MLEVSAVVHAGREHHHGRVGAVGRRAGAQGVEQHVRVVHDRRDLVLRKQIGKQPHHHLAVFQHVRHAGGHAQIVFEHVVHAVALRIGGTHDVDARNVCVDVVGHIDLHHFGAQLRIVHDQVTRNQARAEDVLVVVHVVNEAIECRHALCQPLLHAHPFVRRNDARNQIEGNQALGARAVFVLGAVDRKRNAHAAENHFGFCSARLHRALWLPRQPLRIALVMCAHGTSLHRKRFVHFVKPVHKECLLRQQNSKLQACFPFLRRTGYSRYP